MFELIYIELNNLLNLPQTNCIHVSVYLLNTLHTQAHITYTPKESQDFQEGEGGRTIRPDLHVLAAHTRQFCLFPHLPSKYIR